MLHTTFIFIHSGISLIHSKAGGKGTAMPVPVFGGEKMASLAF